DYIKSSKYGLSATELGDYIGSYLQATKLSQYSDQMLTFPYTKSDYVMYTNMEVLRSQGVDKPAATWDEFFTPCRAAVGAGRQCYAMAVDASGFAGYVFSMGGE